MFNDLSIILASTSPRRHELLNQVGIAHQRLAVEIDETQANGESPTDYIARMVQQKAESALSLIPQIDQPTFVITADTIGVLATGEVLQKPANFAEAVRMWQAMSDTTHQVWTAVQVSRLRWQGQQFEIDHATQALVKTEVQFVALSESMMTDYWQTGEPHDKAGGYAIQGLGGAWVKAINGSYSNVVGLPLVETIDLLKQLKASEL
ncbi:MULTISPECIES: Maf family protein [unclassified Moraxella]|uniref:Maf family protein n=1 Tax=unclassified Moraxella TaxID=2685852 RepID=UPI003AF73852